MSGFGLLNIGTQSLQANQTALNVTGQNISNVNTEGYTRQRPIFQAREGQAGVVIDDVDRVADAFLNTQIWSDSSTYNRYDIFEDYANELDNLMASDVTSISKAMDDYFGALQTAVDDPVSLPNRELFIAEAEALVQRFNDLDANIRRQNETINGRLESNVAAINALATHIAQLNSDIAIQKAGGDVSSELLDQRDLQLEELSTYISFTTIEQPTGEVSVFIGNGEPLVVGLNASTVTTLTGPADTSQLNIGIQIGGNVGDITAQISGGKVGGLLDYRENILGEALDELGRIALVFAETMNEQHQKGIDLDGLEGGLLFNDINSSAVITSRVLAERDNLSLVTGSIYINEVTDLRASEYSLDFDSSGNFMLTREQDGERWFDYQLTQQATANDVDEDGEYFIDTVSGDMSLRIDGFTVTLSGNIGPSDSFILRPTRNAASEIDTVLTEARQLALGTPLATSEDSSNTGTGSLEVVITDPDFANLSVQTNEYPHAFSVFQAGLVVGEGSAFSPEIDVTDVTRINNLDYPLEVEHVNDVINNPNAYIVRDASGAVIFDSSGAVPPDSLTGAGTNEIDLGPLTLTVDPANDSFDTATIEYDPDSISQNRLTPPVDVTFLSALEGQAYDGYQVTTSPVGADPDLIEYSYVFSNVTTPSGDVLATVDDATLSNAVSYPLSLTRDVGGNYEVQDSYGNVLTPVGGVAGPLAGGTIPLASAGLTLNITTDLTNGDTMLIEPDTQTNSDASTVGSITITDQNLLGGVTFPTTIIYDSGEYQVSDAVGHVLYRGAAASGTIDLTQSYGFTIDMELDQTDATPGVLADGDTFVIDHSADSTDVAFVLFTDADNPSERVLKEFQSGETISFEGYDLTIRNLPHIGDQFTVDFNAGGVSDNRNALMMSDLQFAKTVEGASFQDKYGQNVERIGTQAAVAQVNAQAGKSVFDSNKALRSSISGVNLDEEAAKLVQFQQAYQASAQIIRAAQTIFDSLLQSI